MKIFSLEKQNVARVWALWMIALFLFVKGGHRANGLVTGKPMKASSTQMSAEHKMYLEYEDCPEIRDATGAISRDCVLETFVRSKIIIMTHVQQTGCKLRRYSIPLPCVTCLSPPTGAVC